MRQKNLGIFLIVSLTKDEFIKKGFNKTNFRANENWHISYWKQLIILLKVKIEDTLSML